jgi:hypothetical protein
MPRRVVASHGKQRRPPIQAATGCPRNTASPDSSRDVSGHPIRRLPSGRLVAYSLGNLCSRRRVRQLPARRFSRFPRPRRIVGSRLKRATIRASRPVLDRNNDMAHRADLGDREQSRAKPPLSTLAISALKDPAATSPLVTGSPEVFRSHAFAQAPVRCRRGRCVARIPGRRTASRWGRHHPG